MAVITYAQAIQDTNVPPLLLGVTRDLDRRLNLLSETGQNWNATTMYRHLVMFFVFTTTLNECSVNLFLLPIYQNLQSSSQTSAARLAFPRLFPIHRALFLVLRQLHCTCATEVCLLSRCCHLPPRFESFRC